MMELQNSTDDGIVKRRAPEGNDKDKRKQEAGNRVQETECRNQT